MLRQQERQDKGGVRSVNIERQFSEDPKERQGGRQEIQKQKHVNILKVDSSIEKEIVQCEDKYSDRKKVMEAEGVDTIQYRFTI